MPAQSSPARWTPTSEGDVRQLVDSGDLEETHYFDAKREVGGTPGDRKETARDLASFAVDGGTLLIGVEENKDDRTWALSPQPLSGLAEKIEQVASQVIDPPLFISSKEIHSADHPGSGYLLVDVPPSHAAPHMVAGIYYGRGDKTKVRLGDAEILRHHSRRESLDAATERILLEEIKRNPMPAALSQDGFIYLVAQPVTAPRNLAQGFVRGDVTALQTFVRQSFELEVPSDVRGWAPTPESIRTVKPRAHGVGLSSYHLSGPGRTVRAEYLDGRQTLYSGIVDVEIREDGGVRILVGRATDIFGNGQMDQMRIVMDGLAFAWCHRMILWARAIGERCGYRGHWSFGLHMTPLRGHPSAALRSQRDMWPEDLPSYDALDYQEVSSAYHAELLEQPGDVAYRLCGRLFRALSSDRSFRRATEDNPAGP